jgi:hypothetical protein
MSSFIRSFAAVVAVSLLLFGLSLWRGAGIPYPDSFDRTRRLVLLKRELAAAAPSPKLIIVAGSNALYGMRASLIEQVTGRTAVNFSSQAGLGTRMLLFEARRVARPGDTLILPLEPHVLVNDAVDSPIPASVSYALGFDFFRDMESPLEAVQYLRLMSMKRILGAAWLNFDPAEFEKGHLDPIDRWGDYRNAFNVLIDNLTALALVRPADTHELPNENQQCPPMKDLSRVLSIELLMRFKEWASANQIGVVLTWPNRMNTPQLRSREQVCEQIGTRKFLTQRGLQFVGSLADSLLPMEMMHDTLFHPTEAGAALRTKRFLASFCKEAPLCASEWQVRLDDIDAEAPIPRPSAPDRHAQ